MDKVTATSITSSSTDSARLTTVGDGDGKEGLANFVSISLLLACTGKVGNKEDVGGDDDDDDDAIITTLLGGGGGGGI